MSEPQRPGNQQPVNHQRVNLRPALEAILMVTEKPVTEHALAAVIGYPAEEVREALLALQAEFNGYTEGDTQAHPEAIRGFELRSVAGGWRIYSRAEYADLVGAFVLEGQTARLSQAALETLAVIAYRQPVSRARISAIRGVNVDSVVRTLVARGLIEELGPDPETTALLYGTTELFLEKLGLGSVEELPQIAPLLPGIENLDEVDTSL